MQYNNIIIFYNALIMSTVHCSVNIICIFDFIIRIIGGIFRRKMNYIYLDYIDC